MHHRFRFALSTISMCKRRIKSIRSRIRDSVNDHDRLLMRNGPHSGDDDINASSFVPSLDFESHCRSGTSRQYATETIDWPHSGDFMYSITCPLNGLHYDVARVLLPDWSWKCEICSKHFLEGLQDQNTLSWFGFSSEKLNLIILSLL